MSTRKNTLYNMAYRLFSMLLPLVTAPYLSRVVGTEGVGLYGYAWAISYTFGLVGLLGLEILLDLYSNMAVSLDWSWFVIIPAFAAALVLVMIERRRGLKDEFFRRLRV